MEDARSVLNEIARDAWEEAMGNVRYYKARVDMVFASDYPINSDDVRAFVYGYAGSASPETLHFSSPVLLESNDPLALEIVQFRRNCSEIRGIVDAVAERLDLNRRLDERA